MGKRHAARRGPSEHPFLNVPKWDPSQGVTINGKKAATGQPSHSQRRAQVKMQRRNQRRMARAFKRGEIRFETPTIEPDPWWKRAWEWITARIRRLR